MVTSFPLLHAQYKRVYPCESFSNGFTLCEVRDSMNRASPTYFVVHESCTSIRHADMTLRWKEISHASTWTTVIVSLPKLLQYAVNDWNVVHALIKWRKLSFLNKLYRNMERIPCHSSLLFWLQSELLEVNTSQIRWYYDSNKPLTIEHSAWFPQLVAEYQL